MTSGPNRRLCDLTPPEFVALWRRNRHRYDDLAEAPDVHDEFMAASVDRKGPGEALRAIEQFRERDAAFFAAFPYWWTSSPESYDLPVEAAFQARLFELLIPLWRQAPDAPIAAAFGDMAVREVIAPSAFQGTPRAVDVEGHGFIVMPLGWFDTGQYATFAFRRHFEGNAAAVLGLVLEAIVRTVADRCVQELAIEQFQIHPAVGATLRPGIARAIAARHPAFSKAAGDIVDPDAFVGLWGDFDYATATFALAHEAAHVLMHEFTSDLADEPRADEMALRMALACDAWRDRLRAIPFQTAAGKARAAAQMFTYVNAFRLGVDQFLVPSLAGDYQRFLQRADRLSATGGRHPLPPAEQSELAEISVICDEIRAFVHGLLDRLGPGVLSQAHAMGLSAGAQLLREQAPFGGVKGVGLA